MLGACVVRVFRSVGAVTCVVQIPSPCAMVASRCTGCRGAGRTPPSPPRTAAGTRRPRAPPGSDAGRAARPARRRCRARSPVPGAGAGGTARRGRVAIRGQRLGQGRDPVARCGRLDHRPVPPLQVSDLAAGELGDRARPGHLGQEAQRAGGQVVVGVLERAPAHVRDREQLGRAAPSPAGRAAGRAGFDHPVGEEVVQVPPDRGGGQVQPGAQPGRGDRAVLQDEPGDAGPGTPLRPGLGRERRAGERPGWAGAARRPAPRWVPDPVPSSPIVFTTSLCRKCFRVRNPAPRDARLRPASGTFLANTAPGPVISRSPSRPPHPPGVCLSHAQGSCPIANGYPMSIAGVPSCALSCGLPHRRP